MLGDTHYESRDCHQALHYLRQTGKVGAFKGGHGKGGAKAEIWRKVVRFFSLGKIAFLMFISVTDVGLFCQISVSATKVQVDQGLPRVLSVSYS